VLRTLTSLAPDAGRNFDAVPIPFPIPISISISITPRAARRAIDRNDDHQAAAAAGYAIIKRLTGARETEKSRRQCAARGRPKRGGSAGSARACACRRSLRRLAVPARAACRPMVDH
jgi:hypothetical protein